MPRWSVIALLCGCTTTGSRLPASEDAGGSLGRSTWPLGGGSQRHGRLALDDLELVPR